MTDSDTYFDTLSEVIEFAIAKAEKAGYTVDADDFWSLQHVSYGTTERRSIYITTKKGNIAKKMLQVVVYRMESGTYELTCYIN